MKKKNPGKFSFEENKLRITNQQGVSSVLFEDISSISYRSAYAPNWLYTIGGLFLIITMSKSMNESVIMLVAITSGVLTFVLAFKWDDVIIETRGGMLLSYSVDQGEGINQVDKIENEKRKITGIIDGQS